MIYPARGDDEVSQALGAFLELWQERQLAEFLRAVGVAHFFAWATSPESISTSVTASMMDTTSASSGVVGGDAEVFEPGGDRGRHTCREAETEGWRFWKAKLYVLTSGHIAAIRQQRM